MSPIAIGAPNGNARERAPATPAAAPRQWSSQWSSASGARWNQPAKTWRPTPQWTRADAPRARATARGVPEESAQSETLAEAQGACPKAAAERCACAKERLLTARSELQEEQIEALSQAVKPKPVVLKDSLLENGLGIDVLDDLRYVLENDLWDGKPTYGRQWLTEWLQDGVKWATEKSEVLDTDRGADVGKGFWCPLCFRDFSTAWGLGQHAEVNKEHIRKLRLWVWKYGRDPLADLLELAESASSEGSAVQPRSASKDGAQDASDVEAWRQGTSAGRASPGRESWLKAPSAADILARARVAAGSAPAIAKRKLLRYRNGLSAEERREVLLKIGLPRANDVANIDAFRSVFSEEVFGWICEVGDPDWLWREPTFSWLSGFYWHPESTRLPQGGPPHSAEFCHLCEVDCYDEAARRHHEAGRKHAETMEKWVMRYGAEPVHTICDRCPQPDKEADPWGADGDSLFTDIDWVRPRSAPAVEVPDESDTPVGFASSYGPDADRPHRFPYVAVVLRIGAADANSRGKRARRWASGSGAAPTLERVRLVSSHLRIGARIGKKEKRGVGRWAIDLQAPLDAPGRAQEWRSLAVPLRGSNGSAAAEEQELDFNIFIEHAGSNDVLDLGRVRVTAPSAGMVAVVVVDAPAWHQNGDWTGRDWTQWLNPAQTSTVPLDDFVGLGQIQAFGGVSALRGSQRAFQFLTRDLMISFLLYIPEAEEPAPLLIFFHGDLPRDYSHWNMPGLASFCGQYGPAELCSSSKKRGHPCRKFVVVTPASPAEYWWFRYPAVHDSKAYVPSAERWFGRLMDWLEADINVSVRGVRLAGQSMGGYAALELARAMPDRVAAIAAGAPCFDACRLDWLARRIANVPLWVLIGRQDAMCAFEEVASLVVKLRDLGARSVRITSHGIRDHTQAYKPLERHRLYQWLLNPLEGP